MNNTDDCEAHPSISRHESTQPTSLRPVADLEDAEEEKLLFFIKSGTNRERKSAIEVIYSRHYSQLFRMIEKKGLPQADAEDIFAEVWKIALEKLPSFKYRGKPIWHWLSRIAKIQIDAYFRQRKVFNGRFYDTTDDWLEMLAYVEARFDHKKQSNPSPHIQKLIKQTLPKLMAQLSEKEKKVIEYSFYDDLDSTQIAAKLNVKAGTVRQQKRRALAKLAQMGAKGV